MPKLPSARDVSPVSARIESEPGVQAPAAAFASSSGVAAGELAPAIDKYTQAAIRQENRRDTVDRASKINTLRLDGDNELRRLNTEADLSNEETLANYGSFLSQRRQKALEEHKGSPDSRALLDVRLQDIDSELIGRASAIATQVGYDKVITTFRSSIAPLITQASQNPTLNNIDGLFGKLETHLTDIRQGLDPNQENSERRAAREGISRGAIDTLLSQGRTEAALGLLETGGLQQELSPNVLRDTLRRIDAIRESKQKTFMDLTAEQTIKAGFPAGAVVQRGSDNSFAVRYTPPESGSVRKERIQSLTQRFDEMGVEDAARRAEDLVDGNTEVKVLESGQVRLIDKPKVVTKQAGSVTELPVSPAGETAPRTEIPRKETLFALAEEATGVRSKVLSATGRIPGREGVESERKVIDARSAFKLASNDLARALALNPRFPEGERQALIKAFDIEPAVFDNPNAMKARLRTLDRFLRTRVEQFDRDVADPNLSPEIRAEMRANVAAMRNTIDRLGIPQEDLFKGLKSAKDVEKLSNADIKFMVQQASTDELNALPGEVRKAFIEKGRANAAGK